VFLPYFNLLTFTNVPTYFSPAISASLRRRHVMKPTTSFYKKKTYWSSSCSINRKFIFTFGSASFVPLSPVIVTSLFLTRFLLFFKRIVRKKDKTLRKFWLTPKSLLRVSKQSKGARMGKGKGKHIIFIQRTKPFTNFVEFSRVREGRLRFFLNKFNSKMSTLFFYKSNRSLNSLNSESFIR